MKPRGPISHLRKRYEAGDSLALLVAVMYSLNRFDELFGDGTADWVVDAFSDKLVGFLLYEHATLDQAFGVARPSDPRTIASRKKKIRQIGEVIAQMTAARKAGRAINKNLYEEIGERVGFGTSEVKELWKQRHDLLGWARRNFYPSEATFIWANALRKISRKSDGQ